MRFTPSRLCLVTAMTSLAVLPASAASFPPYRDATLPVETRIADLLGRMTLEEKVGQMCQYVGFKHLQTAEQFAGPIPDNDDTVGAYPGLKYAQLWQWVREGKVGSFINVVNLEEANKVQAAALESRLGIPLLIGIDAIHGHGFGHGSTIYPTPLGLAASFDLDLVRRISAEVADEIRAEGLHWTFAPNVDVARDPRWGRVGETFGEDPLLVARMGAAAVTGFRHGGPSASGGVLTCLKHLIAGSEPANGLNAAPMDVSERTLREVHWPPYESGLAAGAETVMLAHHALNGVPCHANETLVEDELRGRLRFDGFVVSDWTDVGRLATLHHVAADYKEAVYLAVTGGLDMHMHGPGFLEAVVELVNEGRLTEARIDQSVRRLLRVKFELGLFEQVLVEKKTRDATVWSAEHQATALEAARKSIVLLKNEKAVLPLAIEAGRRVLVTGPFANNHVILGDWTAPQPDEHVTTIWEGLQRLPGDTRWELAPVGDDPREMGAEGIAAAVEAAGETDVIVAVVGESALRSQPRRTSGENHDRADLDLPGEQLALLRALQTTGKPIVAVLVQSRPLSSPWVVENIPAIVVAGEPGSLGGQAVAEVLAGIVNPSGRLPMSVARSAGHLPSYYNHTAAQYWRNYSIGETEPLFQFGAGLSYTEFAYEHLRVAERPTADADIELTVDITNRGDRAGDEIVLAFVNDVVSSVTTPVRELKAFTRVSLAPGETKAVKLTIPFQDLALYNLQLESVVESGAFRLWVGDQTAEFILESR